ncbi:hypothetical protein JXA70_04910 [candidate division KSB1 bacterium]|nr:hypothetical protein [candidate division KSB1 bacterium]
MIFKYFLIFLLALSAFLAGESLVLEPSEIALQAPLPHQYPPGDFPANSAVRVTVEAQNDWSISCLYENMTAGNSVIPGDRFFVRKQGEDYLSMTSTIHIGSGAATDGSFVEVNTLEFHAHILPTDAAGEYYGSIKFIDDSEQEMAVLPISLTIEPYVNFSLQQPLGPIVFTIDGGPGVYSANEDNYAQLNVDGNTEAWQIKAAFENITPTCNLVGNNHFVRNDALPFEHDEGAGFGYMHLGYDRVVLDGQSEGISVRSRLFFKLETAYNLEPGQYHSKISFDSPGYSNSHTINLEINVEEYLAIEVSESKVNIVSEGPPGEYEADKLVKLKVASNTSKWEARAQGEPLKSDDDEIPPSRLFINSSAKKETGYVPLDQEQIIATGTATNMAEVSDLTIKVKTEWEDKAGEYNGNIYFTVIALP